MYKWLLITLLITGCSASVDGWLINKGIEICKDKQSVDYIDLVNSQVVCNNGFRTSLVWE